MNRTLLNLLYFKQTQLFLNQYNASLKNLVSQVGQLSQTLQNQSRDSFSSDTKKNPKDCMVITLRSDKELQDRKEVKKKKRWMRKLMVKIIIQ